MLKYKRGDIMEDVYLELKKEIDKLLEAGVPTHDIQKPIIHMTLEWIDRFPLNEHNKNSYLDIDKNYEVTFPSPYARHLYKQAIRKWKEVEDED
jgi:hypothetical protein